MVMLDDDDLAELPASSSREISRREVRADRADRPDVAGEVLLPRARQDRRQALRPAARGAQGGRPGGRGDGLDPHPDDDRGAAGARRRDRDADDAVARRGPQAATSRGLDATEHAAKPQRAQDGQAAGRHAGRRLRRRRVRGRLRRRPSRRWCRPSSRAARSSAPEEPKKSTGEVVDLLAALQRSVDAAKTSRGEASGDAADDEDEAGEEEAEPRRQPAKKTPAKKTAAKKAPAKKAAPRRPADPKAVPGAGRSGAPTYRPS